MVGISTSGSGETGSLKNAMTPATTSPKDNSVVATGRRIKGAERFIACVMAVTGKLLSGNAPMQKPHDVTRYRHMLALNQGAGNGPLRFRVILAWRLVIPANIRICVQVHSTNDIDRKR